MNFLSKNSGKSLELGDAQFSRTASYSTFSSPILISLNGMTRLFSSLESRPSSRAACLLLPMHSSCSTKCPSELHLAGSAGGARRRLWWYGSRRLKKIGGAGLDSAGKL
uniref:Gdh1 n=1 Tax=Arundo donax TaxID=35708 RepID=A0A0A9F0G5_ARUDO